MFNKVIQALILCGLGLLLSCSNSDEASSVKLERAKTFITGEANLRQNLPQDILAYVRVPSIWGFYSAPKGNVLDDALANKAHNDAIKQIQESLNSNVISQVDKDFYELVSLLLYRISAPLELAVLKPEVPNPALTSLLLHTQVKYDSLEAFNADIAQIAQKNGQTFKLISEQTDKAPGQLLATMLSVFYKFDPESRSVYFYAGMSATEETFSQLLSGLTVQKTHPMWAVESEIDQSKRGLFIWVNGKEIKPLIAGTVPPSSVPMLQTLLDTPYVALGWGTVNGKDRIKVMTDLSHWSYVNLLPEVKNKLTLHATGQPEFVAGVNIPSIAHIQIIEAEMKKMVSASEWKEYQSFLTEFKQKSGLSLHSLFEAFGSEVVTFSDEAGVFSAIKVENAKLAKQWLDVLVNKFNFVHSSKQLHGKTFNHLSIDLQNLADDNALDGFSDSLVAKLYLDSASTTHLFWVEEDGYWVFASVPQLLMDRVRSEERTQLDQWLKQEQKQDVEHSLVYGAISIDNVPRYLYQIYLSSLVSLADLADAPYDVYSLPSPKDLNLPDVGSFGVQMDVNKGLVSASLTFENNPLEILIAGQGSMGTIVAVGVLSAVALPAYQTYTKKAKFSGVIVQSMQITQAIDRYVALNQSMPMTLADLDTSLVEMGIIDISASLYPDEAVLAITVEDGDFFGAVIYFERNDSSGEVKWRCSSEDIEYDILPATCR